MLLLRSNGTLLHMKDCIITFVKLIISKKHNFILYNALTNTDLLISLFSIFLPFGQEAPLAQRARSILIYFLSLLIIAQMNCKDNLKVIQSHLRHLKKSIVAESIDFTWILPLLISESMLYGDITSKLFLFFYSVLLADSIFCPDQARLLHSGQYTHQNSCRLTYSTYPRCLPRSYFSWSLSVYLPCNGFHADPAFSPSAGK